MSNELFAGDLTGRRVIVFAAETPIGQTLTRALHNTGAIVGVTSSAPSGSALFTLKRTAASGPAEATDLSNPTSIRVATKKLCKLLGGLDIAIRVLDINTHEYKSENAIEPLHRASVEIMRSAQSGRVLLIVSGVADPNSTEMLELHTRLTSLPNGISSAALFSDRDTNTAMIVQRSLSWLAGYEKVSNAISLIDMTTASSGGTE